MKRTFNTDTQRENDLIDEIITDLYAMLMIVFFLGCLTYSLLS
jgi:hypothetical protein